MYSIYIMNSEYVEDWKFVKSQFSKKVKSDLQIIF